jgi:hypothetical protein
MNKIVLMGWVLCVGILCVPGVSVEAAADKVASVTTTTTTATTTTATTTLATTTVATSSVPVLNQKEVEARVREYFKATPVMIEIARCESKFRQFTDAGNVLRGGAGGNMIGVFQFYEQIHAPAALALGFDLSTLEGNLSYAKHLYDQSGTTPWNSARSCWGASVAATSVVDAQTELRIKLLTQLVGLLQQLLALQLAAK